MDKLKRFLLCTILNRHEPAFLIRGLGYTQGMCKHCHRTIIEDDTVIGFVYRRR